MTSTQLYKALGDEQRQRILNLLWAGPLCVCHLMEILGADQVKVSKQLRYLKGLDLVSAERQAQWMVYSLAKAEDRLLARNLECLREEGSQGAVLKADLEKRGQLMRSLASQPDCCPQGFPLEAARATCAEENLR